MTTTTTKERIFTGFVKWNLNCKEKHVNEKKQEEGDGIVKLKVKISDSKNSRFKALYENDCIFDAFKDFLREKLNQELSFKRRDNSVVVCLRVSRNIHEAICQEIYDWSDEFIINSIERMNIKHNVELTQDQIFLETWLCCIKREECFKDHLHFQLHDEYIICSSIVKEIQQMLNLTCKKSLKVKPEDARMLENDESWNDFTTKYTAEYPGTVIVYDEDGIHVKGPILDVIYLTAAVYYKIYCLNHNAALNSSFPSFDTQSEEFLKKDSIRFNHENYLFPRLLYMDERFYENVKYLLPKIIEQFDSCSVEKNCFTVNYFITPLQNKENVKKMLNVKILELINGKLIQNIQLESCIWNGNKCPEEYVKPFIKALDENTKGKIQFTSMNGVITAHGFHECISFYFQNTKEYALEYPFDVNRLYSGIPIWLDAKEKYESNSENRIIVNENTESSKSFEIIFSGSFVDALFMAFLTCLCDNEVKRHKILIS